MAKSKILVTGAMGQVGSELVAALRKKHGVDDVIATDIREHENPEGPFEKLDVMDTERFEALVVKYEVDTIYNLAALLSATAEQKPELGWKLNMEGHFNALNLAKNKKVKKVFWPSSIAVFGPNTPKQNTPQKCIADPDTVYGISKLAGERWNAYYHEKYGVDVRSLRYPGLIGYKTLPGGGTTDYAVDIFHQAVKTGNYECFLKADTSLPMMFTEDAIRATIEITEAEESRIQVRDSYNLAALTFTPEELAAKIKSRIPDFEVSYKPDFRQEIAKSWPSSIDDSAARQDWNWKHDYDIDKLVDTMLHNIKKMNA